MIRQRRVSDNMGMMLLIYGMLSLLPVAVDSYSGDDVKALMKKLFVTDEYNKDVRPMKSDQAMTLRVDMEFILSSIIDFDEQEESLTTAGYLNLFWTDQFLQWNYTQYNDIMELLVPQEKVWKPDISLRNSYKSFTGLGSSYLNVKVYENGLVLWQPFQVLKSTCSVDITYFPFDTQTCEMKFIAWSYTKGEVELFLGPKGSELEEYSPNSAWELVDISFKKEVMSADVSVILNVILERKPLFYLMNVAMPVLMLTVLNIFTFALPVSSGERNGYAITVFLSLAVFLSIVTEELPQNSDVVSLFSVYLTLMTGISTAIVMTTILEMRLADRDAKKQPINKVYRSIHKIVQMLLCGTLPCKKSKETLIEPLDDLPKDAFETKKGNIDSKDIDKEEEDLSWVDVVNSLDFVLFWFTLLFTFVTTTVITVKAMNNN